MTPEESETAHRDEYEATRAIIHGDAAPSWDELPEGAREDMRQVHRQFWAMKLDFDLGNEDVLRLARAM